MPNKVLAKKGAEVQASAFVILFGFGAKSKLMFSECPSSPIPKTLATTFERYNKRKQFNYLSL